MIAAVSMLFTCFVFTACSDNEELPPPTEPNPSVTLTAGKPTASSIAFTVASSDADKCAYRVMPSADEAPDAAAVLASGTSVPIGEAKDVVVDGLTPSTSYTVYAAASAGDKVSPLKTLQMTTAKKDEPQEVTTIEFERADLAYYYTDNEEGTVGNFYFTLVRGELDDHVGFPLPGPDNFMLGLDLYTAMPSDLEHPVLPDGTYTYSGLPGVRGTYYVNEDGLGGPSALFFGEGTVEFKDGTFTVSYTNGRYTLEGTVTAKKDDAKYRFLYTGEIPFVNKDLPQEDVIACTRAEAVWYGDLFGNNSCVWGLRMSDVSLSQDGTPAGAGTVIELLCFGDACTFEKAHLTEGTYTFDNTFDVKTLMRGGQDGEGGYIGSYARKYDGNTWTEDLFLFGGTMTITQSSGKYVVALDAVTDRDVKVKANYSGLIAITKDEPSDDPGFSTLTHDVTMRSEDIDYVALYDFGEYFLGGVRTFNFDMADANGEINLWLLADMDSEGSVPTGTYMIKEDEPYSPFTAAWGVVDADGTMYECYTDNTIGYVKSGTIEVVNQGDNNYIVTWDLVDDTPAKHKITGRFEGRVEI